MQSPEPPAARDELAEMERLAHALPARQWIGESYWLSLGFTGDLAQFLQLCTPERIARLVALAREADVMADFIAGWWPGLEDAINWGDENSHPAYQAALRARAARSAPTTTGESNG